MRNKNDKFRHIQLLCGGLKDLSHMNTKAVVLTLSALFLFFTAAFTLYTVWFKGKYAKSLKSDESEVKADVDLEDYKRSSSSILSPTMMDGSLFDPGHISAGEVFFETSRPNSPDPNKPEESISSESLSSISENDYERV